MARPITMIGRNYKPTEEVEASLVSENGLIYDLCEARLSANRARLYTNYRLRGLARPYRRLQR